MKLHVFVTEYINKSDSEDKVLHQKQKKESISSTACFLKFATVDE